MPALVTGRDIHISWVHSEELENDGWGDTPASRQRNCSSRWLWPPGIEGMIRAARYAREYEVPYLGLCLGMQIMVIEFARHVLKSNEPNSTEFDVETGENPLYTCCQDRKSVKNKGGTMRLGTYPCVAVADTLAGRAYNGQLVYERHRHRFEFNNAYLERLEQEGMAF